MRATNGSDLVQRIVVRVKTFDRDRLCLMVFSTIIIATGCNSQATEVQAPPQVQESVVVEDDSNQGQEEQAAEPKYDSSARAATDDFVRLRADINNPDIRPSDIPDHLFWGGMGGGPSCAQVVEQDGDLSLLRMSATSSGIATPCYCSVDAELGEVIVGTLKLPNGSVKEAQSEVVEYIEGEYCVDFLFEVEEEGSYEFTAELWGHSIEKNLHIGPPIDHSSDYWTMVGWQPNELVRLIVFGAEQGSARFLTEDFVRADNDGVLGIETGDIGSELSFSIIAVGESGQIQIIDAGALSIRETTMEDFYRLYGVQPPERP